MVHEITERKDGTAEAAFALTPAWHGLGVVLDHPMSSGEALTAAQLDWTVEQRSVALWNTEGSVGNEGKWKEQKGILANVRADNNLYLGMVSDYYQVVQNVDAFSFLDELIENHEMEYESAFSLKGGKRVVLLGRLPQIDEIAKDDFVKRYILMSLSHDGSCAIKFGPCAMRVVCANTHAVALQEGTVKELSITHMGDMKSKLRQARKILGMANERFDRYSEVGRELVKARFARDEWIRFLDVMCPEVNADDPDYTERRAEKILETRLDLTKCFKNERQLMPGVAGTGWAAYNAVTEHIDHLPRRGATRERKAEARFNVCLYGPGRDMKERAMVAACKIAGVEFTSAG